MASPRAAVRFGLCVLTPFVQGLGRVRVLEDSGTELVRFICSTDDCDRSPFADCALECRDIDVDVVLDEESLEDVDDAVAVQPDMHIDA